jgi:serine/threonine-protein kinase
MIHLAWEGQLDTMRAALSRTSGVPLEYRVRVHLLERDPDSALAVLQGESNRLWSDDIYVIRARSELSGWAHQMRGDDDAARAAFDSARVILEDYAEENPDDPRVHGGLGFAYAGLGRTADAVRAADRLAEPNIGHPFEWAEMGHLVAQILAQAGGVEQLLEVLESLLSGPSYISVKTVELDWHYDPVRDDPRLQALLDQHADDGEH